MSSPQSPSETSITDLDFSGLTMPEPQYHLIEEMTATSDLLASVQVDTPGQRLHVTTPVGVIAVELYSSLEGREGEQRADFFAALSPTFDPEAVANPLPTQVLPYTILPDGTNYQIVVRAPREAVDTEWSDEQSRPVVASTLHHLSFLAGVKLSEFSEIYPGVDVSGLSPFQAYDITVTERTRPTLVVAARVEDGEPLARVRAIVTEDKSPDQGPATRRQGVHYRETLAGWFDPSVLRPDTAVAIVDSRLTIQQGSDSADRQGLQFVAHDGFQRTGDGVAASSGVVEVVVAQAQLVETIGFSFAVREIPEGLIHSSQATHLMADHSRNEKIQLGGGETRYRAPERVAVSIVGVRGLRAIAAFRFAMAAATGQETPDR